MTLKARAKRMVNGWFPQRRIRLANEANQRLRGLDASIPQHLLDDAVLLTDRRELLRRMPKGGVVAEIGVAQGQYSSEVLEECEPSKYYLIDAWHMALPQYGERAFREVQDLFSDQIATGQVTLMRGWSWDKVAELEDASLDWAYLDAGHGYDDVSRDIEALQSKIRPGGFLCGHDYVKWTRNSARFGVVEAVNMHSRKMHWPFAYITMDHNTNASFALRKPER